MQCISINRLASTIGLLFLSIASPSVYADFVRIGVGPLGETEADPRQNADGSEDSVVGLVDPVMRLNRYTFQNTILEEHADEIPHWVVLFCPHWFPPCQQVDGLYRTLADKYQEEHNTALLTTHVRFAAVDCATEKALCNTQNVNTYPFVAHYRHRKQVRVWRGNGEETIQANQKRFRDFLQQELSPAAQALTEQRRLLKGGPLEGVAVTYSEMVSKFGKVIRLQRGQTWRDLWASLEVAPQVKEAFITPEEGRRIAGLLIVAAIAGNIWFLWRGTVSSGEAPKASAPAAASPKMSDASPTGASALQVDPRASLIQRAMPKEWARDRASLEL